MKADIDSVIEADGYGNTSEFFRDLVRKCLEERRRKQIEELLLEGLNSGESTPFTADDLKEVRRRGLERLKSRHLK